MKRSIANSNLAEGRGPTKARKSLDLGREDRGDCHVDSASGLDSEKKNHEKGDLKDILRRKLQEKQQNKDEKSGELDPLESWHKELAAAGFSVEILHLTSKHCPLEDSEPATQFPDRVLVLYPSDTQTYDHQTGPFHPVRLVVHVNGDWSLQCPIYEHIVINKGQLTTLGTCSLIELAKDVLCGDRTLCPGMLEDFKNLGYKPENIRVMSGPVRSIHAKSCKIWHSPSSRQNFSSSSRSNAADPRWKRVCTECLAILRYVRKKVKAKTNVDEATKAKRQAAIFHGNFQTFQPLSHANLEVLKTSPEKPGDWDLKPGDFQNMCQIIKKALFV